MRSKFFFIIFFIMLCFCLNSNVFASDYYVSPTGTDTNLGVESSPWKTMKKAVESLHAGDTLYVREGIYETIEDAWRFQATGTFDKPIIVRNYPNEQVVFKINSLRMERRAFRCGANTAPIGSANHIKLLGSDVNLPRTLSNGVISKKGLVVLGLVGANAIGVEGNAGGCHFWEIAGFDFIETGGGIFQRIGPSTNWHVHDNRVYNYYRESGMQFNGHNNIVENNQIYLVNSLDRTYGCQAINLVGHDNIIRNNYLSRSGSTHKCTGILFEWDFADDNIITNNVMEDVPVGIGFFGGDRNQIINNIIKATPNLSDSTAFNIVSHDNFTSWPCNEIGSSFQNLLPPNDPSHLEYKYYYNPRNCHSMNNLIKDNQIIGFANQERQGPVNDSTNTIVNNNANVIVISPPITPIASPTPNSSCNCAQEGICSGTCFFDKFPISAGIIYTNPIKCSLNGNIFSSLPSQNNKDQWCRGNLRTKGDTNGDGRVNLTDYFYFVSVKFGQKVQPIINTDFDGDGQVVSDSDRAVIIKTLKSN